MKTKLIVILVLLITLSIAAQPQRPRYGLEQFDPNQMLVHLSDVLALTDEQVEKIEPILLQTQAKLNELKDKSYSSNQEMMEDHRSVMDENAELIEEHLTAEQIATFREMRDQKPRLNKGERPRGGRNLR